MVLESENNKWRIKNKITDFEKVNKTVLFSSGFALLVFVIFACVAPDTFAKGADIAFKFVWFAIALTSGIAVGINHYGVYEPIKFV